MGKPSNRRRSARRPGKRQRARVKKKRRARCWMTGPIAQAYVPGAGTLYLKAGQKKWAEAHRAKRSPWNPNLWLAARQRGEPYSESQGAG